MSGNLVSETFDQAQREIDAMLASEDPLEISHAMRRIAQQPELSLAMLMLLIIRAKGIDMEGEERLEYTTPDKFVSLILPPGVDRAE